MEMERNLIPGNQKLKISLIEDNPNMASLMSTLLEMEGYSTRIADNHHIQGLLQAVLRDRPQIALIDVNLAKVSGIELVKAIRQEPQLNGICILMTSGLLLKKECLQAGADGFIQKPFMPDELVNFIQDTYQQSTKYQQEKE
jgi:two-component system phosphate regulon response regulator OmpR